MRSGVGPALLVGILSLLEIFSGTAQAAQTEQTDAYEPRHALGLAAGFARGVGFSYKHLLDRHAVAVTALFMNGGGGDSFLSVGGEPQWTVRESRYTRFFAWSGAAYYWVGDTGVNISALSVGAGPGIEFKNVIYRSVSFQVEAGLTYAFTKKSGKSLQNILGVFPQCAFYYHF